MPPFTPVPFRPFASVLAIAILLQVTIFLLRQGDIQWHPFQGRAKDSFPELLCAFELLGFAFTLLLRTIIRKPSLIIRLGAWLVTLNAMENLMIPEAMRLSRLLRLVLVLCCLLVASRPTPKSSFR
jgi:hypothetical protein